jgi:hypothetical protein
MYKTDTFWRASDTSIGWSNCKQYRFCIVLPPNFSKDDLESLNVSRWSVLSPNFENFPNYSFISLPQQILGIYGPLGIPLEEYIFFMVIPMAAIFTIEGVTTVKTHWRKDEFGE